MDERIEVAQACTLGLDLNIPTLLDEMTNTVDEAYAALPDRLYVVDADGRIAYRSGPGPMGFRSDDCEQAIRALLGLEATDAELQSAPRARVSTAAALPIAGGVQGAGGTWNVVLDTPMGKRDGVLELRVRDGVIEGTWSTMMGDGDVSGTVGADHLEWTVTLEGPMGEMKLAFTAAVDGDALSGEVQFGMMGGGAFTGTRA